MQQEANGVLGEEANLAGLRLALVLAAPRQLPAYDVAPFSLREPGIEINQRIFETQLRYQPLLRRSKLAARRSILSARRSILVGSWWGRLITDR